MTPTTDTYLLLRAFVDELARCGMRDACTSPGSRSAPLVLTLAREQRLRCHSHLDERCAGFFALGLAKASGLPVAVACTSGTAAAELLPAAVEAREGRVPLLLLTADRPAELRENGAGQAIDQLKLFGTAVKWFVEVEMASADEASLQWIRTLACRAYSKALEGAPGAVHLNFPLREPLVTGQPLPDEHSGRPDGHPYVRREATRQAGPPNALRELIEDAQRPVLVVGRDERLPPLGQAAAAFAAAAGWPLLADPLSGARRGPAAIAHYDALLRCERFAASLSPDLILRAGDLPVSKPLRTWLAGLGQIRQVALDPESAWQDPASVLSVSLALEPAATLAELTPLQTGLGVSGDWLASWRAADEQAAAAIGGALAAGGLSEPRVAAELGVLLPAGSTLFVASSMPVRDIETFWAVREDPPRVLCNRGANGIDGTVSSAFGAAAAGQGPVVLMIGDVALAYDIGGLLAAGRLGLKLTIVLINNDGGGIFDFLPVSKAPMALESDVYRNHVSTPTGLDFSHAAALYGLGHTRVDDLPALRSALEQALAEPRSSIVEVRTSRSENVRLHRAVWEQTEAALRP